MKAKSSIFYSLLFFLFTDVSAQNLVPNLSFEDTLNCPNNLDQVYNAPPWFNPTISSPDYFNACTATLIGTPQNIIGYQFARTGVAYCGFFAAGYSFFPDNRREYIEARLLDSLKTGEKYCVEFYVSLADSSIWAIDFIGAYLSKDSIYDYSTINILPYIPQIENSANNIINDKQNWIRISGEYIAVGGEKFITIGNFRDAATTHADTLTGTWYGAYYYIDDVSVTLCDSIPPSTDTTFFIPNAFSPNGDGHNDVFRVLADLDELHCRIYNRWGELVAELNKPGDEWNGKYKEEDCNTGVYYYYLTTKGKNGKEINKKGNVTLLR